MGTVLATGTGLTLYRYTVDPAGKATCTGACAKVWPPSVWPKARTRKKAPHGVKGLTTIRVHGGRLQVFFHNHAFLLVRQRHPEGRGPPDKGLRPTGSPSSPTGSRRRPTQ